MANDRVAALLEGREQLDLAGVLEEGEAFSPSDSRFTLQGTVVRHRGALRRKVLPEVPQDEQFQRYLPVLELEVLGSADPKHDLRSQVAEDVEILGWVDTLGIERPPSERQFVVQLTGNSMEGGKRPLVDGAWLIMELAEAVDDGTVTAVQIGHVGTYTVVLKRLFDEGSRLRLSSQNPNYEDTVFEADAADDVRVVARFVDELPPPQRTRTGDPAKVKDWLDKQLEAPAPPDEDTGLPPNLEGMSQLELTEKGLLWLLRVEPLPPFVDEITLADVPYPADNVRGRVGRLPTSPSTETFTLEAGPLTNLLKPFEHPGLPEDRATVFRFDSAGRAIRKLGPYVRKGERVRLLLPRGVEAPPGAQTWEVEAWTACELEVRSDLPASLGLRVAAERIETHWETAPQRWHRLPDGRRIPEFSVTQQPVLRVYGVLATRRGEFTLTTLDATHSLPKGSTWSAALQGSAVGKHAVEVTPAATEVAPVRRAFTIAEDGPPRWSAEVVVKPSGTTDLGSWPLQVRGPALWSVEARWQGSRTVTRQLCVGPDGTLPLTPFEIDTRMLRREPVGILTLDFGELGRHIVRHRRQEDRKELEEAVKQFVDHAREGDTPLVEKLAERLLTAFGWSVRDGVAHRPGFVGEEIQHKPHAVMSVGDEIDDDLRARADQVCEERGLDVAFIVAGTTWLRYAPDAVFQDEPVDLADDPMSFMRRFHWRSR